MANFPYLDHSDIDLLYAKDDRENCLVFGDDSELVDDLRLIEEIISIRKELHIWDYSADVEFMEITNELCFY